MLAGRGKLGSTVRRLAASVAIGVVLALLLSAPAQASWGAMTWGFNNYGQLGVGKFDIVGLDPASRRPLPVPGLEGVSSVAQNYSGDLAVMEDGSVRAWGANPFGELGDGGNEGPEKCGQFEPEPCVLSPQPVPDLPEQVKGVARGAGFSLAVAGRDRRGVGRQ